MKPGPYRQHGIPSTSSARLTRLASCLHVCRSLLFFFAYRRCFSRRDQWCRGATRAARQRPAVVSRPDACARRGAQPEVVQRSRRTAAGPHLLGRLPADVVDAHCRGMLVRLVLSSPVRFSRRSLACLCAHMERNMHACVALHVAAVTRSESVARACDVASFVRVSRKGPDLRAGRTRVHF